MDIKDKINPLLTGDELNKALTCLPKYNSEIRKVSASERLLALNNFFSLYLPSQMTCEIYHKLYMALIKAVNKKGTLDAIRQSNINRTQNHQGILGGSDSFTIVGVSGIGKSTAISKAISIITNEDFFTCDNTKIIPFLMVQTPSDSSIKGLLMEVLRKVDSILNTNYHKDAIRSRATLDMLIGTVSQVSLNHIGVLILDEAQNLVEHKNGKNLVNALVQLINNSGISLCFVGSLECSQFFESAFQLARRSIGLKYPSLPYGEFFENLCCVAFSFQYTNISSSLSQSIVEWLYKHSGGVPALVIGLIQAAQEIAIVEGYEKLDIHTLNEAYQRRFGMLHSYIDADNKQTSCTLTKSNQVSMVPIENLTIDDVFVKAIKEVKTNNIDALSYLKQFVSIEEIFV